MSAPPDYAEPVHSIFGGSTAPRLLRCSASVSLVQQVPAYLRKVSSYAARGAACHTAITLLLDDNPPLLEGLVGTTFGDYTITSDDVENDLRPTFAYIDALLSQSGAEFYLERRVVFPGIADTYGTADLIARIGRTIHVIDFKFGAGVRVLALSPDGDEDVINAQLLFYACGARNTLPEFFAGVETIVLTIVQPQSIEPDAEMVSSVEVTNAELDAFVVAYHSACQEALSDTPRLQRGAWCRFCAARPICPAHTAPLLDLAQFVVPTPPATLADKTTYLQALADGLNLVDAVRDTMRMLHQQAKRALENGDTIPGFALTLGRAERHWRDEITAQIALLSLGFEHDDIIEAEMMRSPKQLEIRAKARGLKIPQELIVSNRSGVSLTRIENVRDPVLGRVELARMFSEALEAFQGGRQA
jgi:hypothetical protein